MKLNQLSDDAFFNNGELKTLDLSYNSFVNISSHAFHPLRQIEEIDLSHNEFEYLDTEFLEQPWKEEHFLLRRVDLEPCASLIPQSRVLVASSNIAIIATISVVVLILIGIVISVIIYRQQSAVYYTHEGERTLTLGVLGIPAEYGNTNGGTFNEDKEELFRDPGQN
ncbi:hypothetical protein CEXT_715261 [Caerostris extrusa]|uniref:Uncharacterized protein n=1 Tax=Caerostris extrusa TaxID=172846 RepID=A0AAV4WYF3_CAEEX|nr:hypothetical protein CEXT_715261 [Caerostris extrusa]